MTYTKTPAFTITEQVTPELAVTADQDGLYRVTHLPTGALVTRGNACLGCARRAAQGMADLRADWSKLTVDNRAEWFARMPADDRDAFQRDYWSLTEGCTVTGYAQRF